MVQRPIKAASAVVGRERHWRQPEILREGIEGSLPAITPGIQVAAKDHRASMRADQFSGCGELLTVGLYADAEVHGVEVNGEQRVIALSQRIKGDASGLGCTEPGFCRQQMAVHEVRRSREGQHASVDFVLHVTPHEGFIKRLLNDRLVLFEWHCFLKKD